eukprot:3282767-Rhodomonas_salina.1
MRTMQLFTPKRQPFIHLCTSCREPHPRPHPVCDADTAHPRFCPCNTRSAVSAIHTFQPAPAQTLDRRHSPTLGLRECSAFRLRRTRDPVCRIQGSGLCPSDTRVFAARSRVPKPATSFHFRFISHSHHSKSTYTLEKSRPFTVTNRHRRFRCRTSGGSRQRRSAPSQLLAAPLSPRASSP